MLPAGQVFESLMALPFVCLLCAGLYLSFKSRFVQFRALGQMGRLLLAPAPPKGTQAGCGSISPRAALLTAMSTTIGVGNVVGPIVAIGLGGPGALLCYVLATLLGGATIFTEVSLSMEARRADASGTVHGGPMQYLRQLFPPLAPLYAIFCSILLLGWTAANANTIAMTLGQHQVPRLVTGFALSAAVVAMLAGGIGRISRLNEKLVPLMCGLYCGATLWIIFGLHSSAVPHVLQQIWQGFWTPQAIVWGAGSSSVIQVLRHGLARALQANEAGVGTSTIAHAMAATGRSVDQATLAMASVYFNGVLCLLTGMTILVAAPLGAQTQFDVVLLNDVFAQHLSHIGGYVLAASIFMFAFGTILGNSFNGGHCFVSLLPSRHLRLYYLASGMAVFAGSLFDLRLVFAGIDYLIIPVVVINATAVVVLAQRNKVDFSLKQQSPAAGRLQRIPLDAAA